MFIHPCPEHQADAVLNQDNPDSGTKYTVLDTTKNVRIVAVMVACTWTVQPTPLEIHITIDGQPYTLTMDDPASGTCHFFNYWALTTSIGVLGTSDPKMPFLLEGRSVKIEAEITGGTVSNLSARVKYAKW